MILVYSFENFFQTIFLIVANQLTDTVGIHNSFESIFELNIIGITPKNYIFLFVVSKALSIFYGSCKVSQSLLRASLADNRSLGRFFSILVMRFFPTVESYAQLRPK
jgi:hypothetical protein